jgi:methionyl-tRNA formyltransferase
VRILLITRNSVAAWYLAAALVSHGFEILLVVESGGPARKRKMRREFRKRSLLAWPIVILNIISITIYSTICDRRLAKSFFLKDGICGFPTVSESYAIDDVNTPESRRIIKTAAPDLCVVMGVALLNTNTIESFRCDILNVHGGMVPWYRNVHGDFWALVKRDFDHLGTSILYLDSGIDSGDIGHQRNLEVRTTALSIVELKESVIRSSTDGLTQFLAAYSRGERPREKQQGDVGFYRTPTFMDLVTAFPRLLGIRIGRSKRPS